MLWATFLSHISSITLA